MSRAGSLSQVTPKERTSNSEIVGDFPFVLAEARNAF
jgi:hypothetical protein